MANLSWQCLVFLIPIGLGTLLAIGAALGLEGGAEDDGGVAPLSFRLMVWALSFGGIGLCVGYLGGREGAVGMAVTTLASALVAWWISRRVGWLFATRLPLLETESAGRRDLVGTGGRAVLAIGPGSGLAQVHDARGKLHQVVCRTLSGEAPIAPGAAVLLVDYDEARAVYRASAHPLP